VSLLKPDMVMVEDGDRTEATWQISLDHLKERLGLLGDEVRVIAGGGRGKELEVPLDPTASVLEAGGVRMELFSEEETEIVSCEPAMPPGERPVGDETGGHAPPRRWARFPLGPASQHLRFLWFGCGLQPGGKRG
jgi:hypothetical protein